MFSLTTALCARDKFRPVHIGIIPRFFLPENIVNNPLRNFQNMNNLNHLPIFRTSSKDALLTALCIDIPMAAFFAALLFSLLLSPIIAVHSSSTYNCSSYTVPLRNISAPSFDLTFEIKTQWDITDWTINEARRDSATAFNGIAGPSTVVGDFDISARFCTPSKLTERAETVLVMTHGLGADKT
jgi:hypothetical protein